MEKWDLLTRHSLRVSICANLCEPLVNHLSPAGSGPMGFRVHLGNESRHFSPGKAIYQSVSWAEWRPSNATNTKVLNGYRYCDDNGAGLGNVRTS